MTVINEADEPDCPEFSEWDVLERHLINLGHLSPEGVGRRAQPRRCRACERRIMVGLDDDRIALRADADPSPTTAVGEMIAQLEGRRTFALVISESRYVLDYRDAGRIAHRPAGTPRLDILVEHRCDSRTRFPIAPSNLTRNHALACLPEGAPCPY